MSDLAQDIELTTRQPRMFDDTPPTRAGGLLQLQSSATPIPVYVYTFTSPITQAGFAATADATTFYTGGIGCPISTENAQFITFVFLQGTTPYVTGIDCDLPYSATYTINSQSMQAMCIPPLEFRATYSFFISFSNGAKHDPQIVVTPQ